MSTISVDVSSSKIPVLQVGYQGENEVTEVLFNISSWIEEYGGGTAQIRVKRPQNSEDESYLLSLPISDGVATWTVTSLDTANKGNGKVQLNYLVGTAIKDSVIYPYKVGKSIVGADSPVDPYDSWIERSKAWAIGELLDDEEVPPSDETYRNNSKFYAEQADASAEESEAQATEAKTQADAAKQYAHQFVGAPRAAAAAADMTDHDLIYVFTGTTTSSLTNGHWYYWSGSAWTDGGVYNSTAFTTDTTLSVSGAAADAKVVGDLKEELNDLEDATTELVVGDAISYTNNEPSYCWQLYNGVLTKRTSSAFSTFHVVTFPVEANKNYIVTGCLYAPATPVCVFADADGNVIGSSPVPADVTPQYYRMLKGIRVKTPANCAYIYVNFINLSLFPTVTELNNADTFDDSTVFVGTQKLTRASREDGAALRYVNGGYGKSTSSAFGYWHIDTYNVEGGKYYEVSGSQITNVPIVVYFNIDNTIIGHDGLEAVGYDAINKTIKVKTPDECIKIAVNVFRLELDSLVYECELKSSYYKRWADKKWCVIGDSLTASNGTSIKKYHEFVSQYSGISVENYGKGGTGFANPNGTDGNFVARMASVPTDSDVYTIFGSFNDVQYGRTNNIDIGEATDTGTTTMCGYFNSALDALYARVPLANVGVVAPCPWAIVNQVTSGANETYGTNYVKALEAVCKRRCIPFLNLYEKSGFRPWDDDWKLLIYTHDNNRGVHPNEIGHEILSTKFEAFLDELLH